MDVLSFAVGFLALDRVPKILPIHLVESEIVQAELISKSIGSVSDRFPLPRFQVISLLEAIIRTCEAHKFQVAEEIYEILVSTKDSESAFGRFRIGSTDVVFRVHGDPFALVQDGSTGFMTWEAGKCLCWYLSCLKDVRGKRILEIGCGTGVTGIVTCKFTEIAEYVFTDYHISTLENARSNWDLNFDQGFSGPAVQFQILDMYDSTSQRHDTDVVVASDVLYDKELAVALVNTLENAEFRFKEAIIASTIRTRATYDLFLSTIENSESLRYETIRSAPFSDWVQNESDSKWRNFLGSKSMLFDPTVELIRISRIRE